MPKILLHLLMAIESYLLWEKVSKIVLRLPGVHEKLCFDTPAYYVEKKFFVRLNEDGETIVLYNNDRDDWIAKDPDIYFITDHYKYYPMLLIDLRTVPRPELTDLLKSSWKIRAPKKLLSSYRG